MSAGDEDDDGMAGLRDIDELDGSGKKVPGGNDADGDDDDYEDGGHDGDDEHDDDDGDV